MKKFILILSMFISLPISAQYVLDNELFFDVYVNNYIKNGYSVIVPVKGKSMTPFIFSGERVLLEKAYTINIGDIVLAHLPNNGGMFVVHRVYNITDEAVILMGDGNITAYEVCHPDSVKAVCNAKYKDDYVIRMDTDYQKSKAELWKACLEQREELISVCGTGDDFFWKELFRSSITSKQPPLVSIRPSCEIINIENNKFIFNTANTVIDFGKLIKHNKSAMFLFNKMKGKKFTINDMMGVLLQEYNIDEQTAYDDCVELLISWFHRGILKIGD